jgi:prolyl-tRNA editing enzyme YbaK/EbsC (Cys-tRNA(Pro) deacylase)
MDHAVLKRNIIYCGGGDERSLIKTIPREILRVNGGTVEDIRA